MLGWLHHIAKTDCIGISMVQSGSLEVSGQVLSIDSAGEVVLGDSFEDLDQINNFLNENPLVNISLALYSDQIVTNFSSEVLLDQDMVINQFSDDIGADQVESFVMDYAHHCYSFARKPVLVGLIDLLSAHRKRMVSVALGSVNEYAAAFLLGFTLDKETVQIGKFSFQSTDTDLTIDEIDPDSLKYGEISIRPHLVSAFCAALNHLGNPRPSVGLEGVVEARKEMVYLSLFAKLKFPLLYVLFGVFLINTGLYLYLKDQNEELSEKAFTIRTLDERRNVLNDFVTANQSYLEIAEKEPDIAMICDMIGASIPRGIALTDVIIERYANEEPQELGDVDWEISVRGEIDSPKTYTSWMRKLKTMSWVREVTYQKILKSESRDGNKESFYVMVYGSVE